MLRKLIVIVLVAGIAGGMAFAEEQQPQQASGLSTWLKSLQKKMGLVTTKKPLPLTTGVAGVRGAKQDDQARLYWKGKDREEAVTETELTDFKSAVDLVEKGDAVAAAKGLETFMQQYPDSALIPDAKKTLDLVKAEAK